jgi:Lon protease-like protein
VLFPNVFLPLHVFEDRYREMVRDALSGDRIIGMVLLKDELDSVTADVPAVYQIGCSGVITHSEPLDDGRFNVVLRGLEKFKIQHEDHTKAYRQATTEIITDAEGAVDQLNTDRRRLERVLDHRLTAAGSESRVPPGMADMDLVNALSQYLDLDPVEKQALLERNSVSERCRSLIDVLEMRALLGDEGFPQATVQ